jgi:NAD(P)-dependent dehydrogenase (short-subunit alcohol dehydrogenase family)
MIAAVTGGSGALGASVCRALAAGGARVAIGCFRHPERAAALADELRAAGARAEPWCFDVADPAPVQEAFDTLLRRDGGLDVLVNAAACSIDGLLFNVDPESVARVHAVNVLGTVHCIRAAIPLLLRSRRPRIVNFSSAVAHRASSGLATYAATKGAVEALTRALAVELGSKRVTVNAVAPGFVDAGLGRGPVAAAGPALAQLVPAGRAGRAEEVAAVVAFLVSEAASYVNGVVIPVDGGVLAGSRPWRPAEAPVPAATTTGDAS